MVSSNEIWNGVYLLSGAIMLANTNMHQQ